MQRTRSKICWAELMRKPWIPEYLTLATAIDKDRHILSKYSIWRFQTTQVFHLYLFSHSNLLKPLLEEELHLIYLVTHTVQPKERILESLNSS